MRVLRKSIDAVIKTLNRQIAASSHRTSARISEEHFKELDQRFHEHHGLGPEHLRCR